VSCLGVTDGVTPRARAGVTEWAAQTGITPKAWRTRRASVLLTWSWQPGCDPPASRAAQFKQFELSLVSSSSCVFSF
jgi:hypothetical protein